MAIRNRHMPTRCFAAAMLACLLLMLPACNAPLLSPDEPRSPFDRYDAVRNQRAEQRVLDDYGRQRPALRERLMRD